MIYTPSKNLRISLQTFVLVAVVFALLFSPLDHPVIGAAAESGGIKVYCNGNFRGSTAFIDARSGVGMVPLALIEGLPGLRLNVRDNRAWFALNGRELTTTLDSSNYIMDGQQYHWRCGLQPWKYGIAVPARDLLRPWTPASGGMVRIEPSISMLRFNLRRYPKGLPGTPCRCAWPSPTRNGYGSWMLIKPGPSRSQCPPPK